MATSRASVVSCARYTSPMPPAPICAVTSYEPNLVPEGIAITLQPSGNGESIQQRGHPQEKSEAKKPSLDKSAYRYVGINLQEWRTHGEDGRLPPVGSPCSTI